MAIVRKEKKLKAADVLLTTELLGKGLLARIIANCPHSPASVSLEELANWMVTEDGDITDVLVAGGLQVFTKAESDQLLTLCLTHPALVNHPIHGMFEINEAEVENAAPLKPVEEPAKSEKPLGFRDGFRFGGSK